MLSPYLAKDVSTGAISLLLKITLAIVQGIMHSVHSDSQACLRSLVLYTRSAFLLLLLVVLIFAPYGEGFPIVI